MAFEFVVFTFKKLLTHQQMDTLADNDDFLKTAWANYRRPNLKYINSSVIAVEENTDTAEETKIVQRNGDVQFANGNETTSRRTLDITQTADFTGPTPKGGLHFSYTLTNNRWYHIYAVKIQTAGFDNQFVLVADELAPTFLNTLTLTPRYGLNQYAYMGTIRYGDSVSAPNVILDFVMAQGLTLFKNTVVGVAGRNAVGIQLASASGVGSLTATYTRTSGSGDTDIPETIDVALYMPTYDDQFVVVNIRDAAGSYFLERGRGPYQKIIEVPSDFGIAARQIAANSNIDVFLAGFRDGFFRPEHNSVVY